MSRSSSDRLDWTGCGCIMRRFRYIALAELAVRGTEVPTHFSQPEWGHIAACVSGETVRIGSAKSGGTSVEVNTGWEVLLTFWEFTFTHLGFWHTIIVSPRPFNAAVEGDYVQQGYD